MDAIGPEEDEAGCDCCPHASHHQNLTRTLMGHLEEAIRRQNLNTDALEQAAQGLADYRTQLDEQERMLQQMAIESYELKGQLLEQGKRYQRLHDDFERTQQFLAALGYSKRLKTTEDAPPA